jgi:cellulose synthase/poly-beta-1,6-N-acetylglucosamine synthase-like glycosyltransferase
MTVAFLGPAGRLLPTNPVQFGLLMLGFLWILLNLYMFAPVLLPWGPSQGKRVQVVEPDLGAVDSLPSVDVFVPAYREGSVIENAVSSVRATNYPSDLVNVTVLVEPDDDDTRGALAELDDDYEFTVLEVPDDYPGDPNKPRALNFGFELTDSDLVGVVDAENEVAPGLFAKAVTALEVKNCDFVQGRVDMVNEEDGWLNTLFRAEYGYWYRLIVPAQYLLGYPIPLSGTTCLFDRSVLESASERRYSEYGSPWTRDAERWFSEHSPVEFNVPASVSNGQYAPDGSGVARTLSGDVPWNPNNVTEDFELGLFLWKEGFNLGLVESVTTEESPRDVDGWIKQRTRWQKGKIQTFLQYLRSPPSTARSKLHLFGRSVLPHIGPINLLSVVLLVVIANLMAWRPRGVANDVLLLSLGFVPLVSALFAFGYWRTSDAPIVRRIAGLATVFLTVPIYWLLQWLADLRAAKQIYLGEFHWEKTIHEGLEAGADSRDLLSKLQNAFVRARWLLPVLALGLFLRVYQLGERSYWLDEVYAAIYRGGMPLDSILLMTSENHPPLYYALLHFWMEAFGNGPVATRALSVVFGLATIWAVYALGAELFDRKAGIIAALLVATSTMHVFHSQNVRMYEMLVFLSMASLYFFWRSIRTASFGSLIWYSAVTWLLVLTHLFAGFVVLAQNVYVFGSYLLNDDREGVMPAEYWITSQAAVGLLSAPWAVLLGGRVLSIAFGASQGKVGWIEPPSLDYIAETFLVYAGYTFGYQMTR